MNSYSLRVLDITESLILLAVTFVIVTLIAWIMIKNKILLPLVLSLYGGLYCILIIYVFGEGYTGIPFVLISWVFIFTGSLSILALVISKYKASINSQ